VAPDFGAGGLVRIRGHWRGSACRATGPAYSGNELTLIRLTEGCGNRRATDAPVLEDGLIAAWNAGQASGAFPHPPDTPSARFVCVKKDPSPNAGVFFMRLSI